MQPTTSLPMLPTALAAVCVALCALYVLHIRRRHDRRDLLTLPPALAATACLVILETLPMLRPNLLPALLKPLLFCQFLLCPTWLLFSLAYARAFSRDLLGKLNKLLLLLSVLPLGFILITPTSSFYYQTDFRLEPLLFLEPSAFFLHLLLILLLLLAVGNLESTLHNSRHSDRWRIKLALLGAATVIASLVVFYSQGLLFKVVNMQYLPLRSMGIIAGLSLMHYAEWRRESGNVVLSRRVAFRSAAVIAAGLYLFALGLAREGTRFFGTGFEQYLAVGLLLLLGLGGLLLLLSHTFRRKAAIWMQRNLYNEKYDYRGQWIQFSERLSQASDKESLLRAILLGFCETFGFVGAVFVPVDNESPGRVGRPVCYEVDAKAAALVPAEDFAPLLRRSGLPESVEKAEEHLSPALASFLAAMDARLIMAVHATEEPEGLIVMGAPIDGREKYDVEDYELMEAMGRQIALCVRSFRLGDELVTAREMEALGRLGTFVLHDLKNQVYALSLLADNARRFIADPEFQQDMLETLGNTVANMNILITQLTHLPRAANLRLEPVDLYDLATRACARVPGANVMVAGRRLTVPADAEQMGKVFTNLCLNAVEAGGTKPIRVEVAEEDVPVVRMHDQAGGIAEEVLRSGLFKPFTTTKQRGMGIGLYHSRKIVEAHGGSIRVESRPGEGSTFIVRFENRPDATPL